MTAVDGPVRYDPNVLEPHHHLVCVECRAVYDVRPHGVDTLRLSGADRHRRGFDVAEGGMSMLRTWAGAAPPSGEDRAP